MIYISFMNIGPIKINASFIMNPTLTGGGLSTQKRQTRASMSDDVDLKSSVMLFFSMVGDVALRLIHVPGKSHLTEFGLRIGTFALDWFQNYYGIPYPGMIVINPVGEVVGKLFLEAYSSRVDSAAALAFARKALGVTR